MFVFPIRTRNDQQRLWRLKRKPKKARILIVDDHPLVRRGLTELFNGEDDLEVCGEAAGATDAIEAVKKLKPDLLIIDISLEDTNGIELIKRLRAQNVESKMLVSSMHDESLYAERALRAGAQGFVNKEVATENVLEAVRKVLTGAVYLSNEMTGNLLQRVVDGTDGADRSSIETLSDRELEVFERIGDGLTTREIAEKLDLSVKTIETHREHIKIKLRLRNSVELTRRAVQWVLEKK